MLNRVLLVAFGAGAWAALAAGGAGGAGKADPGALRCRSLEVVDSAGRVRIRLETQVASDRTEPAVVTLYSEQGDPVATLGDYSGRTALTLHAGPASGSRAELAALGAEAYVWIDSLPAGDDPDQPPRHSAALLAGAAGPALLVRPLSAPAIRLPER